MAFSATFYARSVTFSSASADMNVQKSTTITTLRFVETDRSQLSFTYNGGKADPDTQVYVNGSTTPTTFIVEYTGLIPNDTRYSSVGGIDLRGKQIVTVTIGSQKYFFFMDPAIGASTMQAFPSGMVAVTSKVTSGQPLYLCFVAGTRIDTPSGPVRVETLREGDLVCTLDGPPAPLRLRLERRLSGAEVAERPEVTPIRIPAHALGRGLPAQDLLLSPQHRLWLSGWQVELLFAQPAVLVAARHLALAGIGPVPAPDGVHYVHLLFDRHEVVIAEGMPCESWQPATAALDVLTVAERDRFLSRFSDSERAAFLSRPDAALSLKAGEGLALSTMLGKRAA